MGDQDIALMAHLMRRAGFGATREELEAIAAKGYEANVEELLNSEDQPSLDRNEMMRYHPWTWRPRHSARYGRGGVAARYGQHQAPAGRKDGPLLAWHLRHWRFQGGPL